jgi:hypothetical protein
MSLCKNQFVGTVTQGGAVVEGSGDRLRRQILAEG